jgi:PilZ domain-containing protein
MPNENSHPLASFPFPFLASLGEDAVEVESPEAHHGRQRHQRWRFKVSVTVRDASGALDSALSEDVSRSGFGFTSEKYYIVGEVVLISISCGPDDEAFHAHVCIVRRENLGISRRRFYGGLLFPLQ